MIYLYAIDIWQTYLKSRFYEVISTFDNLHHKD